MVIFTAIAATGAIFATGTIGTALGLATVTSSFGLFAIGLAVNVVTTLALSLIHI